MDWIRDTFLSPSVIQTVILISLVSIIGLFLGRRKVFGVSLGITFVFFTGIVPGHLKIKYNANMLSYAQVFGLISFVYSLGLQVGPGFFSALKKGGIALNLLGISVIFSGIILSLIFYWFTGFPITNIVGMFCGAVTNTPALGAAQQTLIDLDPANIREAADMALACAVTYPMGVVGVILAIVIMKALWLKDDLKNNSCGSGAEKPLISEYRVCNPAVFEKNIENIMKLTDKHGIITRVWRDGSVLIPSSDLELKEGDHLLIMHARSDKDAFLALFGFQENADWNNENIDWNKIDCQFISRRVIVTRNRYNGVQLGALHLRNTYGINITRVNRAGIDLMASPKLRLQIGDKMTVVGPAKRVEEVVSMMGNEMKRLENPNLLAIFVGVLLGVILGTVPISLPGISTPVKFGLAGGPIIVGILVGAFGPRFHITTYTTNSANLMLRQFGIVTYLAALGIQAGEHFFETVFRAEGLMWIAMGIMLTLIPVLLVGFCASHFFKIPYSKNVGMLCASMANPMALNYANTTVDGDEPSVAYATVYPISMFLRVISVQVMIMLFA